MIQKKYVVRGTMSYYFQTWTLRFTETDDKDYRLLDEGDEEVTFWTIGMAEKAREKIKKLFPMAALEIVPIKVKLRVNHPYGWEPKDKKE